MKRGTPAKIFQLLYTKKEIFDVYTFVETKYPQRDVAYKARPFEMDALFPALVIHDELQLIHMISTSLIVFGMIVVVLYDKMPTYGRYVNTYNSQGRGFCNVSPTASWLFQELPAFFIPCVLLRYAKDDIWRGLSPNVVVLGLYLLHYFHRAFIYPFMQTGRHATPFLSFVSAVVLCASNGYLQGRYLTKYAEYEKSWLRHPSFISGTVIFFAGMAVNIYSDQLLRNLRKPGETGYRIPKGGLFEYVSSANYLGEIIEWFGFALASYTYTALAFAIFVACFLGHRASHHHKFYEEKFEDYPKDRAILVPFVW